jgi:hypothetical protein
MDFRYPTVRLRKFADFFLTRYIRCTFFGGPTKFKAILENHAPFFLLQALSNEFGKLVLRVRRVWSFLRHVLGGDDPGLYYSKEHTGINRGSSAKKCSFPERNSLRPEWSICLFSFLFGWIV